MNPKLHHAQGIYLDGIRDGDVRGAIERHTGDRYTQHSTGVPDGADGFAEFFDEFMQRNPQREIRIVRPLVDGPFVFLHAYQNLNEGQAEWVTMDFFDTDERDRVVEHWDVIAPYSATTPSGHTSIDGATDVVDEHLTGQNKALMRSMIEQLLMPSGDPSMVDEFIGEHYIQHNAEVPDGRAPFAELVQAKDRPLQYHQIVLLVGQGNFVATLSRASWEGIPYAQADLVRAEDGRIVEHWDAAEPVPDGPQPNSGKF